jgi:hypothetical protein
LPKSEWDLRLLAAVTRFGLSFFLFCFVCLFLGQLICHKKLHAQHPGREVADLKGEFADAELAVNYVFDTELAVNHVFCWFMEEWQSLFMYATCIQVSTCKLTKCMCLHLVFNTMDSSGTNKARALKEVGAYVLSLPGPRVKR